MKRYKFEEYTQLGEIVGAELFESEKGSLLDRDDVFSMLHEIIDSLNNLYDISQALRIMAAEGFEVEGDIG